MTADAPPRLPNPGPLPSITLGDISDERLPNGMRVVTVRRSQIPIVQLRLAIPLGDMRARDGATLRLLPKMLLAGTRTRTGSEIAAAIQRIGASVVASASVDFLTLASSAPASRLPEILELLSEIVSYPSFSRKEIAGERERVVQEIQQEEADPVSYATRALDAQLFPQHQYADPLPGVASVRRAGHTVLSRFHSQHLRPLGSSLVVVGDVGAHEVIEIACNTLGAWSPIGTEVSSLAGPRTPNEPVGILLVHRPNAVQSNLRIGVRCGGSHDPGFPALVLATTIFGGSFISRLVANLRERNGYTYAPRSEIDERRLAAALIVRADIATEVTAQALTETRYELARMATSTVTPEELEGARRYVMGELAMATATQAEFADTLAGLVMHDHPPSYLEDFMRDLAEIDANAIASVAASTLGPVGMTTVVVGDAMAIADSLSPLDHVKVVGHSDD